MAFNRSKGENGREFYQRDRKAGPGGRQSSDSWGRRSGEASGRYSDSYSGKKGDGFYGKKGDGYSGRKDGGFSGKKNDGFSGRKDNGSFGKKSDSFSGRKGYGYADQKGPRFFGRKDGEYAPDRRSDAFGRRPEREVRRDRPDRTPGRGVRNETRYEDERRQPQKEHSYREWEYTADSARVPAAPAGEYAADSAESESYILTGRNPIREALKNGRDLEKLLVQKGELSGSAMEIVAKAKEKKIMVQVVEKSRLDEISPRHQGLIAFASAYQYAELEDILADAQERGEDPFLIILDGITDPHNLGAIIRTAECCGAHGVIVPQHRSAGLTPAAVKASAGAVEYIRVARVTNLNHTIEELQRRNIWVYAITMNGTDYRKVDFKGGTALVIGAEGEGISRLTEEKCDVSVSLPMKGHIDSLNASVAAGIMMYRVMETRV